MEQNNFEKNIQQRLSELKIPPSGSVWNNVEKKIAKKKKDRRMIFILFFLILFLLSGGYWLFSSTRNNSELQNHQLSNTFKNNSKSTNKRDSSLRRTEILPGSSISGKTDLSNVSEEKKKVSPVIIQNKKDKSVFNKSKKSISAKPRIEEKDRIIFSSKNEKKSDRKNINIGQENKTQDKYNVIENKPGTNDLKIEDNDNSNSGIAAQNKINADTLLKNADTLLKHKEEKLIVKKDSSAKKSYRDLQKHKWTFGITLSGGKSVLSNGLLSLNKSNSDYYASMPSSGMGNIGTSNPGNGYPSSLPIKTINSTAFIGGVFIEKNISDKTKISLGINYKYFSVINKTGTQIDSAQMAFNSATYTNTYRSNFNYLELPVSFNFRLTNNKSLPVYWLAGINISQLISSNALQFKSDPGIYYNDNSLFNKTQLGFSTGFFATLFSKQKTPVNIGPYFYYNASRLANEGLYGGKHFDFIGIKAEILLKKK